MLTRVRTLYRENRAFRWAADLTVLLAVILLVGAFQTRKHLRGVALPQLSMTTLEGQPASLDAYKGKKTLVYLWAPWCGVCKAESQNVTWTRALAGDRANVISIATGYESTNDVRKYVDERGVGYPVLLSDSADRAFRVSAFPTVYFVDANGKITSSVTGYTTTLGLLWRLLWA